MPGNLTPPIFSEAVVADAESAGVSPPADSASTQSGLDAVEVRAESEPIQDSSLLEELKTLRQWQNEASRSRLELIESHERRERELAARLHQAQEIIEADRCELARVQALHAEQRTVLNLQQEQHQSRLRQVQESLSEARQELERGQVDLQGLRQRCAFLEQERDQGERCVRDLDHRLQATREELALRSAELAMSQHRCDELEQERLQSERLSAARVEALEHERQVAREQLAQRSAELTAAQHRCEELEQERLQSERLSAARVEALEHELQVAREQLAQRSAELTAALHRCDELEQQGPPSESDSSLRFEQRQDQPAASRQAAETDQGMGLLDLETQRLRDELTAMQQMLEDLPEIYEHKFRQRLQLVLEQRDWLLHENNWLRSEWPTSRPELQAALQSEPAAFDPAAPRRGLLQSMLALLPFGRQGRRLQAGLASEADPHARSGAGADQPGRE